MVDHHFYRKKVCNPLNPPTSDQNAVIFSVRTAYLISNTQNPIMYPTIVAANDCETKESVQSRMSMCFALQQIFIHDLSSWDVSRVKAMSVMFDSATSFNQDLSSWDVSSVTDM